jgi:hypothetical protein
VKRGGYKSPPFLIMGKLLQFISKLETLSAESVAEQSLTESTGRITEAQRQQLEEGTTSSGGTLRKYRSPAYARMKNQMNPRPGQGNPDLKLTGAFYRGITATVSGGKVIIKSSDDKALSLEASYGKDQIFGLNPQTKKEFIDVTLRPLSIKKFRKEVGL